MSDAGDPPITECEFEDVFELAAAAKDDGIYVQRRTNGRWFRAGDAGMVCLWEPGNRSSTKRISHTWVHPDHRGDGLRAALFEHALAEAVASDAETVDIYVYDTEIVAAHGFEHRPEDSQAVNDAEYYVLDGDALDSQRE